MKSFQAKTSNKLQLLYIKDEAEWDAAATGWHVKLTFQCNKCEQIGTAEIANVYAGHGIACKCVPCPINQRDDYRLEVVKYVNGTRFRFTHGEPSASEWPSFCQNNQVNLTCQECDSELSVTVQRLKHCMTNNLSLRCLCYNPTEQLAAKFLERIANDCGVTLKSQYRLHEAKGSGGGALHCDFAFINPSQQTILLVEVDGCYHFQEQPKTHRRRSNTSPCHDLIKEKWAISNGISMVRVSNTTVNATSKWAEITEETLIDVMKHPTSPFVKRIAIDTCYAKSVYSRLRLGTELEVVDLPII